jgi:site-specific recombinase XerD
VAAWLLSKKNPNTRTAYRRDVMAWIDWCELYDVDPLAARQLHVDAWREAGAGFTLEEPANSTIARRLSAVSSFYEYLLWEEVVPKNPLTRIERPEINRDHSDTRGLTKDEARDLMVAAAAHSRRARALIQVGILDGLRCSEMVMLDVPDLASDQGHRTLNITRKGGWKHKVPVSPGTYASFEEYRGERELGPMFVTSTGRRITPDRAFRIVRQVAAMAEIERPDEVTPHSLRHTFITLALNEGVPLRDVQYAAGHRDPRTTERYDRQKENYDRHPAYVLARALAG